MDETATNYNADATVAGDCEFPSPTIVEFSVDMNNIDMEGYNNVVVNGSWNGWAGWGVELSDADADGIWTGSAEFAPGSSFEYVVALTSGADGWSGWGQIFHTECTSYINEEGATAGTNFMVTVGEVGTTTTSVADVYCDPVSGCTDPTASNYDASATDDDESCIPCTDNSIELMSYDAFGDSWNGATFTMTDGVNTITSDGVTEYTDFASEFLCVPAGCYEVTVGGGATDYEISFTLGDLIVDAQAGTYTDISVGEMNGVAYCDIVLGCTDS
jgi:hypothetical protein